MQIPLLELEEATPISAGDWSGQGHHLKFPKPGGAQRRALLVPGFLGEQETEEIHKEARRLADASPKEGAAASLEVIQCGDFRHPSMEALLKPLQSRLMPLLKPPELVASSAAVRWPKTETSGLRAECVADHDHCCTAVLVLGALELLVQPVPARRSRRRRRPAGALL